jgi:predicted phosphodiesterase
VRFALLSDVHGNLAGLRAVKSALEREGTFDQIVVAGDHLQGGPRPREVWDALRRERWILLRGNEDEALVTGDPGDYRGRAEYRTAFLAGNVWTRAQVGQKILAELAALPTQWRTPTTAGDLLVVHASPRSTNDRAGAAHNTDEEVAAAYSGTGASLIAFGHYHRNFVRSTPFALLVNVASVSLPTDGIPLASYTILMSEISGWVVEQRHVPYDPREEARVATQRGMPAWRPDEPDAAAEAS